ncbi:MAG: metallophosphoesterase [Clostridia bacterium]|nr:metallophosphoesterase [Clostridia bacterium]
MKVYAIGDLHLQGGDDKPMNVFGPQWEGHFEKISSDWRKQVTEKDAVLVPGDISWAMQLKDALPDLEMIAALPGIKVLLRGNHDYWWPGIGRLRSALPAGMLAIQNDAARIGPITVCGTRGWTIPGQQAAPEDQKIYSREVMRLRLSLEQAARLGGELIGMTHYPPVTEDGTETEMSRLFSEYGVGTVVYGHLHGASGRSAFQGRLNGVQYYCVSCDQIHFQLFDFQREFHDPGC